MNALIARIARAELDRRHANVRAQLSAMPFGKDRTHAAVEANAKLHPWVAIAVRCGADVADFDPAVGKSFEYWRRDLHGREVSQAYLRYRVADDFCPEDEMLAELTRARDVAISKILMADNDRTAEQACVQSDRAQMLSLLAIHLGCPPVQLVEGEANVIAWPTGRIAA